MTFRIKFYFDVSHVHTSVKNIMEVDFLLADLCGYISEESI